MPMIRTHGRPKPLNGRDASVELFNQSTTSTQTRGWACPSASIERRRRSPEAAPAAMRCGDNHNAVATGAPSAPPPVPPPRSLPHSRPCPCAIPHDEGLEGALRRGSGDTRGGSCGLLSVTRRWCAAVESATGTAAPGSGPGAKGSGRSKSGLEAAGEKAHVCRRREEAGQAVPVEREPFPVNRPHLEPWAPPPLPVTEQMSRGLPSFNSGCHAEVGECLLGALLLFSQSRL